MIVAVVLMTCSILVLRPLSRLSGGRAGGPAVPREVIRALIENQLGKPLEELFATSEPRPVAAAWLSQVHRATLPDGTVVAVKVQRPDLERLVCRDLDVMELLNRLVPRRLQRTNLRALFAEFRRYTLQEIDFSHEGRVIDRFRVNFKGRVDVKFPRSVGATLGK